MDAEWSIDVALNNFYVRLFVIYSVISWFVFTKLKNSQEKTTMEFVGHQTLFLLKRQQVLPIPDVRIWKSEKKKNPMWNLFSL